WHEGHIRVCAAATGKELYTLELPDRAVVEFLWFSPDSRRLIAVGFRGPVRVCDAATREVLAAFKAPGSPVAQVSPDGKYLVANDGFRGVTRWDLDTGRQVSAFREAGFYGFRASLAFTPDGRRLVAGSWDGRIRIRDADSGLEVLTFPALLGGKVAFAEFRPDGRLLATPYGWAIRIWDGTPLPAEPDPAPPHER